MSNKLIGHGAAMTFLARAAQSGRLAHAYLFVGPEHVGKRTAALTFASDLFGTANPLAHADFSLLERERDAKTGRLHGTIVIDQVRALVGRLALGSFLGGYKVCVIDGAHLMTPDAANALLKTLEEPRSKTVLLLTAPSEAAVLPTILSRCQVTRFGRVPAAELREGLAARGIGAVKAELCARLAGGLPGAAVSLAEDEAAMDAMFALRETLLRMPSQPVVERWAAIDKLLPAKLPFQEAVDRARGVTDLAAELVRDALLSASGRSEDIAHVDEAERVAAWGASAGASRLAAVGERVTETRELLAANVSPRTALERLTLSF